MSARSIATCGCGWRVTSPTRSATRGCADAGRGLGRGRRHRSEALARQLGPGLLLGADLEALGVVYDALQLGLGAGGLAVLEQDLGIAIARLEANEPVQQHFDLRPRDRAVAELRGRARLHQCDLLRIVARRMLLQLAQQLAGLEILAVEEAGAGEAVEQVGCEVVLALARALVEVDRLVEHAALD